MGEVAEYIEKNKRAGGLYISLMVKENTKKKKTPESAGYAAPKALIVPPTGGRDNQEGSSAAQAQRGGGMRRLVPHSLHLPGRASCDCPGLRPSRQGSTRVVVGWSLAFQAVSSHTREPLSPSTMGKDLTISGHPFPTQQLPIPTVSPVATGLRGDAMA